MGFAFYVSLYFLGFGVESHSSSIQGYPGRGVFVQLSDVFDFARLSFLPLSGLWVLSCG